MKKSAKEILEGFEKENGKWLCSCGEGELCPRSQQAKASLLQALHEAVEAVRVEELQAINDDFRDGFNQAVAEQEEREGLFFKDLE